ncbi:WD40 repeat domain-containing serine/threonine protein kinase [Roseimaritima ulvae]|uniref:non-specific serine/threonine protein kinase n=1 Tax=Roseimaritima ulvae TaxID=980254 RepID=A0A5B9QGB6_9BACT|nr:WD40 repeat domain-containing serine/threonine protein kinase [Roseimaritima ulvae]QEG38107.1 Serine/threonine-protein kinase PrkC [Roseimaritima ulvae]
MSSTDPLAALAVSERNELEVLLMEFDGDWEPDALDTVGPRIATHPDPRYRDLALGELVKIDLQRRWATGAGRLLEDYLQRYPALGTTESVSADLIVAEYEARHSVAPELVLTAYQSRFPNQFDQVEQLAGRASQSKLPDASPPNRTENELAQASIDTSRVDQLRDTKAGGQRTPEADLPVEFGRYRILKTLGAGAMGKVYLAHDNQLDRQVALKTPSFSSSDDDDMVTRFYREARSAAKIQHRNICPIYDVGQIDGRHFISMAFIKGRCMAQFIKPEHLPPQRTSAILVQRLAVALAEAHKHNVIHRDLKPANIMIDLKKEPIVMDFGLARQMDVESRVTQSGMAVGTPAYMSPEQIRGELDTVGAAADIYALGVILYELLTGRLPFQGPIAKVVYGIVHEEPPRPSAIREGLDPRLESICAKMMAKDLAERYRSMDEVAMALKDYVKAPRPAEPTATSPSTEPPSSSSASSTSDLTETGALNAFFAAQPDPDLRGTIVEPSAKSIPASVAIRTKTASQSNRNHGGRKLFIALGSAGAAVLLLGIVIYFKGGKVELDPDSDAVVKVDNEGQVTIHPGSEPAQAAPAGKSNATVAQPTLPERTLEPADLSRFRPAEALLNEWQHDGADLFSGLFATLSPNGQRVAFRMGEGPLKISETASKQLLKIPAEMEDATSIAFALDRQLMATGHDNKKIRLWDAVSFAPFGEPFESPIEQRVLWVHLSADGTKLIAMGNDHDKARGVSTFCTWDVATRKRISQFQVDIDAQSVSDSIDASADGSRVAVISRRDGPMIWDTSAGKRLPVEFEVNERLESMMRITGMDLSADGSRLAYGTLWGGPSYAAILDTSTGKELWNSGRQRGRVYCVQFTRDGRWLASTAGRTKAHQLSLWNVATGAEVHRWTYPHDSENQNADMLSSLSFSEDGSRLLLCGLYIPIAVWNLTGQDNQPAAAGGQQQ